MPGLLIIGLLLALASPLRADPLGNMTQFFVTGGVAGSLVSATGL